MLDRPTRDAEARQEGCRMNVSSTSSLESWIFLRAKPWRLFRRSCHQLAIRNWYALCYALFSQVSFVNFLNLFSKAEKLLGDLRWPAINIKKSIIIHWPVKRYNDEYKLSKPRPMHIHLDGWRIGASSSLRYFLFVCILSKFKVWMGSFLRLVSSDSVQGQRWQRAKICLSPSCLHVSCSISWQRIQGN